MYVPQRPVSSGIQIQIFLIFSPAKSASDIYGFVSLPGLIRTFTRDVTMSEKQKTHEHLYLTPHQAAEYLNSSTSTLAKRRLYGGGPKFSRIGRAVRYAKRDLDEFMASNTVSSTSEELGP
jgi:excisionase family DNA binding protein